MDYPVGDFLIRIKNAYLAHQQETKAPFSRLVEKIAQVLKKNNLIADFSVDDKRKQIIVSLLYQGKIPGFSRVKIFSKPGRRFYLPADKLLYPRGKGIIIVSTSKGIMTAAQAVNLNLGGEVIAEITK